MLFRSPSSLPISARVVAVKPLRAKHLAAAERIEATRGFSQSAARCCAAPFSSGGLRGLLTTGSVVFMFFQCTGQPVSVGHDGSKNRLPPSYGWGLRAGLVSSQARAPDPHPLAFFPLCFDGLESRLGPVSR